MMAPATVNVIFPLLFIHGFALFPPLCQSFVTPRPVVITCRRPLVTTKRVSVKLGASILSDDTSIGRGFYDAIFKENDSNLNDLLALERHRLKEEILEKADAYQRLKEVRERHHLEERDREEESLNGGDDSDDTKQIFFLLKLLNKIVKKITRGNKRKKSTKRGGGGGVTDIVNSRTLGTATLEVGEIGASIIKLAEELSKLNPTLVPTRGWKGYDGGDPSKCPLDGTWKLRFTTAADASFSVSPTRGKTTTSQDIDARVGTLTNVVDFERGKVKGFRVVVGGEALSDDEIALSFRKVVIFRESRFPRYFGKITFWIPSGLFRGINKFLSKRKSSAIGPYLKLQYVDDDFRMHKTGEGNWFIQTRLT